jgi:P pilus assembly chaperone PapD
MRRYCLFASLLTVLAFSCGGAAAMSAYPLVLELQSAGRAMSGTLRVTNDGVTPMPVEFKISRIEINEDGTSASTPAEKEFIVFPPLATVQPGKTQAIRVQWAGNAQLEKSQSYIFSINQLPIKFPETKSGMQLIFNFAVVVDVAPVGATATLNLVSSEVFKDSSGERRPRITVENKGNRHVSLGDASIALRGGSWTKTITGPEIKQMMGVALVQPGKRRRFTIPIAVPPEVTALSAQVDYRSMTTSSISK